MNVTAKRIVFSMAVLLGTAGFIGGFISMDSNTAKPTYQSETSSTADTPRRQPEPIKQAQRTKQAKLVKVKSGDTLARIAKREKSTVKDIYNANKALDHPDNIEPGDTLVIPDDDAKLTDRYSKLIKQLAAEEAARKRQAAQAQRRAVLAEQKRARASASSSPDAYIAGSQTASTNGVWDRLAACEAGGNWSINTGNGYYGGLQFSLTTWRGVGGSGYPHQASKSEQIRRGEILRSRQGWSAWPSCAAKLGLL